MPWASRAGQWSRGCIERGRTCGNGWWRMKLDLIGQPLTRSWMTPCPFELRLEAFHDGELSPAERLGVEQHLAGCGECAAHLRWLESVSAALSPVVGGEITPAELAAVHAALEDVQAGEKRSVFRAAVAVMSLAASILIVSLVWYLQLPSLASPPRSGTQVAEIPAWERTAVTLRLDPLPTELESEPSLADARLADWMLSGLSGERSNER